jgi:hypothetical protein
LLASTARQEDLDGDAVAFVDAPPPRCVRADAFDHADGFVSGDERVSGREDARVLLVVGSAQTARFDAEKRIVVSDVRE